MKVKELKQILADYDSDLETNVKELVAENEDLIFVLTEEPETEPGWAEAIKDL